VNIETQLGPYAVAVDAALAQMAAGRVVERIWAGDHTVWKPEPAEITNRLGWLRSPQEMRSEVGRLETFAKQVHDAGYDQILLLGMGGSSLAPELFAKTLHRPSYPSLRVLDSTDPAMVLGHAARLDPERTLFIVSTKSGGTVETLSFFRFFYNWAAERLGAGNAGRHFAAITDPGSTLVDVAQRYRFRATFLNDPDIGGRYSALSHFGLVPAALVGADVPRLLDSATTAAALCRVSNPWRENAAAVLGAILGEMARLGRDKLTLVVSPAMASLGDWAEQLVAESTGKQGTGIVPVVGEPLAKPSAYGDDRVLVYLGLSDQCDPAEELKLGLIEAAGNPVLRLEMSDIYDLGGQLFVWEMATAVAGQGLGINPFDQPNVEAAKAVARQMVSEYKTAGVLPAASPAVSGDGMSVFGDIEAPDPGQALVEFMLEAHPRDYVALQAYLPPTAEIHATLQALRLRLRNGFRLATTLGYGPRFLHSTGQLHKGDAGRGLFIQFTADDAQDAAIPDQAGAPGSSITFGVLKAAQAMGDRQALLDAGRRVIRFHLGSDAPGGLKRLSQVLG